MFVTYGKEFFRTSLSVHYGTYEALPWYQMFFLPIGRNERLNNLVTQ